MAEILALISIAELQSMIVTQTLKNPNIVPLQTKCFFKKKLLKYDSHLEPKWNPNKYER